MAGRAKPTAFGSELRRWRTARRFTQERLANDAGVSQRHLSHLENGRSRPSPEMVLHLSATLDVPLRSRNELLVSAGFAPTFTEASFDGAELSQIRRALEQLVEAHHPAPAFVVDRRWELLLANDAAADLIASLVPAGQLETLGTNTLRLLLHPDGIRTRVLNWEESAAVILRRLRSECIHAPDDLELRSLLDEVLTYPAVAALPIEPTASNDVIVPIEIRSADDAHLRFFTTITSLAGPTDVTLSELRLETLLPADAATAAHLAAASPRHDQQPTPPQDPSGA
jgi:transcriptional regulator with XRE-family HTH domain